MQTSSIGHTIDMLQTMYEKVLQEHPYTLWAKKFDETIHIPSEDSMAGTLCGSVAYLLGNNYAPQKQDKPICQACLKLKAADIIQKSLS